MHEKDCTCAKCASYLRADRMAIDKGRQHLNHARTIADAGAWTGTGKREVKS